MESDKRPSLAATITPLRLPPRESLAWLSSIGVRGVAISATDSATRPRGLDRSARRDLVASMSRLELHCTCVDCFLPIAHFLDSAEIDRATNAAMSAVEFAAEIAALEGRNGLGTVVLALPTADDTLAKSAIHALTTAAERHGVRLAVPTTDAARIRPPLLVAVDPAQVLANGGDPAAIALAANGRLGASRIVDLLRSGTRGPIGEPREGQLEVSAFVSACRAAGFAGEFVIDMRQWMDPRGGLLATIERFQREVFE